MRFSNINNNFSTGAATTKRDNQRAINKKSSMHDLQQDDCPGMVLAPHRHAASSKDVSQSQRRPPSPSPPPARAQSGSGLPSFSLYL